MLIVISPAKTLDFESPLPTRKHSQPAFLEQSEQLVKALRRLSPDDIADLMHVSSKIAEQNYARFHNWDRPFSPDNARPSIYAFKGDVYTGLNVSQYQAADLEFAQKHLRILSGLYGVLRPLDLMQAYRLEMGTSFRNKKGKNLYEFWGEAPTQAINKALQEQKDDVLINLASNEYFKVLDKARLNAKLITPVFKDYKNGKYKVISFFAKKARGLMASYIVLNRIKTGEGLKKFKGEGYRFSAKESDDDTLVFLRKTV